MIFGDLDVDDGVGGKPAEVLMSNEPLYLTAGR